MEQSQLSQIYSRHREILSDLFSEAMSELKPEKMLKRLISYSDRQLKLGNQTYTLHSREKVYVIGMGKASGSLALALESVLGDIFGDGLVIVNRGFTGKSKRIQFLEGDHPTPSNASYAAALELKAFLKDLPINAIVINLISGGTSSVLYEPPSGVELKSAVELWNLLLESGASIQEINTVRKQISAIHGGRLLRFTKNHFLIDFILSDVPGNDPASIGSAPTTVDDTKIEDALFILKKYGLIKKIPSEIASFLFDRLKFADSDKPLRGSDSLIHHHQFFLGTSTDLAKIIAEKAERRGFSTRYSKKAYSGSTKEMAIKMAKDAIRLLNGQDSLPKPALLIYHGESYVNVRGSGIGGRNQELALTAAIALEGQHKVSLMSIGTDGKDGPTPVAGAIINGLSTQRARKKGLEPEKFLQNNDSFTFFSQLSDTIQTEKHVTNLMDIQLILVEA